MVWRQPQASQGQRGRAGNRSSPPDREGNYEPTLARKGRLRLSGFDEKVIALHARGMKTGEIQAGLLGIQAGLPEIYGVDLGW